MMSEKPYNIPQLPLSYNLETVEILRQLNRTSRSLAELKGVAQTIPNDEILINSLALQEAKDSSSIENIVTTHDELYKADAEAPSHFFNSEAVKVLDYRVAIFHGFSKIKENGLLTNDIIKQTQAAFVKNTAGFRAQSGTTLKNAKGEVVYTPPQDPHQVEEYMSNLEKFINTPDLSELDPLIKMAIIHHQFESIHPFYDGNGRTGRIISILYLIINGLLEQPILYLSRYIVAHKGEYYRLLQAIRDCEDELSREKMWQEWILFNLKGIEETALHAITTIKEISKLMQEYKKPLRDHFKRFYKHELLNALFSHPYTKIEFISDAMQISRNTASKYLNAIVELGLLKKFKIGTGNYYVNEKILSLFMPHKATP